MLIVVCRPSRSTHDIQATFNMTLDIWSRHATIMRQSRFECRISRWVLEKKYCRKSWLSTELSNVILSVAWMSLECRVSTFERDTRHLSDARYDARHAIWHSTLYRANVAQMSPVDLKFPRSTRDICSTHDTMLDILSTHDLTLDTISS